LGIGDWGWGLGPIPHPQSPIPNSIINFYLNYVCNNIIFSKV